MLPLTAWITLYLFFYLRTGYVTNEKSGQSALNLPVWPLRVIFCLAFLLLALQVIAEVAKSARVLRKGA